MNSIFATTAPIGPGHGGGIVSYYELKALMSVSDVNAIIALEMHGVEQPFIKFENKYYPDNPFMNEYKTFLDISDNDISLDLAFVNGAPWNLISTMANTVIVDCPAHNFEESLDEFRRLGIQYPFKHMIDPELFKQYTRFIQHADLIICPSIISAEYLKKNPGTSGNVVVIPHGVTVPNAELTELLGLAEFPKEFTVGYIGANGPDKGLIYLYRAWAGLMYRDAKLLLAGSSITKEGLPPYLKGYQVLGRVNDTSDFYRSISVYVQPSVTEAFGLTVLEAMAHKRPVIVTEGTGASELITHGVDGFIVPVRRPDLIADYIDLLKNDSNALHMMAENARVTAEKYPWDRIQSMYENAIKNIL